MSGNLHNTNQHERDLELVDTLTGSATACANIARKLDALKQTTAACLSSPLGLLVNNFFSIGQSYTTAGNYLRHRKPDWGQNVSLSIESAQDCCQRVATELSSILERHGEWNVLAVAGSCQRLKTLSKSLRVLIAHQTLLFKTVDLIPVLARKPAEHESPESIAIPARLNRWEVEYGVLVLAGHEEFRTRLRIAREAEQAMDRWSRDYADSLRLIQQVLRQAKEQSKELLTVQKAESSSQTTDTEEFPVVDDWSTTQSTIGIMTPTEDWSDLGSDTTEIVHTSTITRHSLQLCGYITASFLRQIKEIQSLLGPASGSVSIGTEDLQRLHQAYDEFVVHLLHALDAPVPSRSDLSGFFCQHQVIVHLNLTRAIEETKDFLDDNNIIEESFGHLPGSTPVGTADIEAIHKAYAYLVGTLLYRLGAPMPFQKAQFAPAPVPVPAPVLVPAPAPASVSIPAPEVPRPTTTKVALEAIINSMEPNPTDKDIMKLVFHWTTLEECNGFKRAEVMKLD